MIPLIGGYYNNHAAVYAALLSQLTFDAASAVAVTLSNGNLTATNTGTTSTNQGARVLSAKTSGLLYFEVTLTNKNATAGGNVGLGIGTDASTYGNLGDSATTGTIMFVGTGNLWANGSNTAVSLGGRSTGDVIGIAVDLTNHKAWFRVAPSGNWNASGTANPATNTGGIAVTSSAGVEPCVVFGGAGGTSGNSMTMNLGATSFVGTAPSGASAWGP